MSAGDGVGFSIDPGTVCRSKRYPEHKNSGVSWLGEVPAGGGTLETSSLSHTLNKRDPPPDGIHPLPSGILPVPFLKKITPAGTGAMTPSRRQRCGRPSGRPLLSVCLEFFSRFYLKISKIWSLPVEASRSRSAVSSTSASTGSSMFTPGVCPNIFSISTCSECM